jgi:hypothetical protein
MQMPVGAKARRRSAQDPLALVCPRRFWLLSLCRCRVVFRGRRCKIVATLARHVCLWLRADDSCRDGFNGLDARRISMMTRCVRCPGRDA